MTMRLVGEAPYLEVFVLNAMKRGLRGGMLRVSPRSDQEAPHHVVRRIGSVKEAPRCLSAR